MRRTAKDRRSPARRTIGWLTTLVVVALVVTGLGKLARFVTTGGHVHPEPRVGISAAHVMPASMVMGPENEMAAYEAARAYPAVLDGLYCWCDCSQHGGHRSLLTCFESLHAASCEVCQREALLATQMHRDGATLTQIRQAADAMFRT